MNYKELFAIDKKLSQDFKDFDTEDYDLYDYDTFIKDNLKDNKNYVLVNEFYLNYFFFKILFEIDLVHLNRFIDYHFNDSDYQEELLDILEYKVIPLIGNIIEKQSIAYSPYPSGKEIKLGLYFQQNSENIIFKPFYELEYFYYLTYLKGFASDLKIRRNKIESFVLRLRENIVDLPKLFWIGNASHLGFLISELIEKGFIQPPYRNGSLNIKEISRQILNSFDFGYEDEPKPETLERNVNKKDKKNIAVKDQFIKAGFRIPYSKAFEK